MLRSSLISLQRFESMRGDYIEPYLPEEVNFEQC